MNMQDKDMDALFRSKLDDYEVEPSPMVWANISEELGAPGQRKSIIPVLRIAASVAIVISAGAYFWPKQQKVEGIDKPKQMAVIVKPAVNNQPTNAPQTVATAQPVNTTVPIQAAVHNQPKQVYAAIQRPKIVNKSAVSAGTIQQPLPTPTTVDPVTINQSQQVIAAVSNTPSTAVQPASAITAASGMTPVVPEIKMSGSSIDAANTPVAIASLPAKKHTKIRGLGGLLNAAIGLVDRREDKVIEFTNNEDGDTITGINLGVVSIKKSNK